ncbi:hypothetical protein VitviT2T_008733 [Vitis vinifera]|uniref:Reverse transcriptase domain-containing protein n=1 Tax=Vitis vinifera TaxID=29760 RepID=A0ABY9C2Q2_VITVI|nr:hypothetical protein VitviT2T_008733 [Vitis vinifera]
MEKLSNIFSVLQLDADDDQLHMPDSSSTTDKKEKKGKSSSNLVPSKNEKNCEQDSMIPSEQYRLPLVWIDLEMTGLLVEGDRVAKIVSMEMIESPLAWISGTDESLQAEATRAAKGDCSFVRSLGVEVVEAVVSIRPLNVVLADRSSAVTSSGRKGLWLCFTLFSKLKALKASLKLPFTEEEVHLALMGMNGDKAPGLDGFTGAFWQFCWEFVKEEILEMFKEFHEQKAFLKSLNTTFLVLIPKKGGAEELGDFRPISLVGGLYKLLAKVLANRIKNVVGKVVSSDQNAFVMNRQILDASLIANEVIDSWKKRGEKGLICKLDIEKAYDSVNWKFLMRVMQKMGFGVKWREWIWSCISTAKFSVLINGEPAGFFSSSRGLRQGDPLSPYLFIMGMEVLSAFIRRAVEGGCISGCRIQRGRGQAVNISHLLFADDAIVFCEAKKDDMTFLSWILCWFEAASGLRINLAKSEIIPVGEVEEILEMAVELGCKVGKLPSTYLGLPLGAPNKAGSVWDGVEERMRWKLALWKRQYISKGGRIALIKSTLVSMPLYQMSLFRMPRVVARRLEKLQRDFLWGGGSMERKAHLVNWERVCMGKEKGGLGLRKLIPLNKALLGKWVWRFANAKEEMWKRVLVAKYGQEEFGWRTKKANGVFGVGVWKEVMKEADWCWDKMNFKVGKGTKIRFWKDPWCGEVELARRFPQLFNMAAQRSATVGELWDHNSDLGRDMVLFVEEQSLRKQALEEYKKWVIMEETYWR